MNSDTPRTDNAAVIVNAKAKTALGEPLMDQCVDADFARQLERENAELVEALEITCKYLRDDLWVSGEVRQIQRDKSLELLTKHKSKLEAALAAQAAQQSQEPFAWVTKKGIVLPDTYTPQPDDVPLYTTPPTASAAVLRAAKWMEEAAEDIESWGAYASEYFQEKHELKKDGDKYRERAKAIRASAPADVVVDKGPWVVSEDGRRIESDDFTHDVTLEVKGDFYDDAERKKYADGIAAMIAAAKETGK